jgi:hypothetical protein
MVTGNALLQVLLMRQREVFLIVLKPFDIPEILEIL